MFRTRTLERVEEMLDSAMSGEFQESDYDESKLSRLESKWKQFLATSQLSHQRLEEKKQNVESLVSDISHQTKTPIANMRLYAELLEERMPPGEELCLVQEIHRQADKLEFLLQSLTKMSRLESNSITLHPEQNNVWELMDEVLSEMQPRAAKKGLTLVDLRDGTGNLPECNSDERKKSFEGNEKRFCNAFFDWKWTKEALGNILDNAIKYSEEDSQIEVSLTEYELYIAVSVRDHGIGIAEEEQAKIFGRFYRSQTVATKEGVGLGLYLAREILQRENGYIRVRSVPEEGSEFRIFLWRSC